MDVNGILSVFVKDKGIGKEQSICIEVFIGLSKDEIVCMKVEVEVNVDVDCQVCECIEKFNGVENLVFQMEKQLKEFGEKFFVDKKEVIEKVVVDLKVVCEVEDISVIDQYMEMLNVVWQVVSQEMYQVIQDVQVNGIGVEGVVGDVVGVNVGGKDVEDVIDVEYEEVEDK